MLTESISRESSIVVMDLEMDAFIELFLSVWQQ